MRDLASFLAEIKLKWNDGMHKTSCRQIEGVSCTVPVWVTRASVPFGNLTEYETCAVILVNNEVQQTIWFVAPVSIIQELSIEWSVLCVQVERQEEVPER